MADEKPKKLKKPDEDPVGKIYDSRLMRRLGSYLRPYWIQVTISTLAVSLKSLSDVAGPYLVMVAIDRYLSPGLNPHHSISLLARWLQCRASRGWPRFTWPRCCWPIFLNSFRPT
jgi:ATP-binding cassette subfamily B protein